ncbi:MAG: lipid-transfer protein [Pseudomonadota bacterium]
MSRSVIVAGVGMGTFTKPSQQYPYEQMGGEAVAAALKDAGIALGDVQQAYASYIYGDSCCGQKVINEMGMPGIPIFNLNNNCASGSSAVFMARQAVASGMCDAALAFGFEQMQAGALKGHWDDRTSPAKETFDALLGARPTEELQAPPAAIMFGSAGAEYMETYAATPDLFGKVAVKSRRHAAANPSALFKDPLTLEDVMSAPVVFGGFLTRLMCCPPTCGAAAAVLVSEGFARKHGCRSDVIVSGQGMASDTQVIYEGARYVVGWDNAVRAANTAYEEAGIGPKDVDVVELHDCFTPNEILSYEALGLCGPGEAIKLVDEGDNTYGGRYVINPSGGLMSKGHPIGATGLAQCYELVSQLRGEAENRQVQGARIALQHNIGVPGGAVVTIYQRA